MRLLDRIEFLVFDSCCSVVKQTQAKANEDQVRALFREKLEKLFEGGAESLYNIANDKTDQVQSIQK